MVLSFHPAGKVDHQTKVDHGDGKVPRVEHQQIAGLTGALQSDDLGRQPKDVAQYGHADESQAFAVGPPRPEHREDRP
ncbi:MAG: hypothetical protein AAFQ66_17620, partial [Pseudomonadota bacterium]